MGQTRDDTGRCVQRYSSWDRLPKNLIEALSAFGMRSYMRNDPAKERARERLVTVEHEKSDMWREG